MAVAIIIEARIPDQTEIGFFIKLIQALARHQAQTSFILISNSPLNLPELANEKNMEAVNLDLPYTTAFYEWRLKNKIASTLRARNVSSLISFNNIYKLPSFLQFVFLPRAAKNISLKKLKRVSGIITLTQKQKEVFVKQYDYPGKSIAVIYGGADAGSIMLNDEEKKIIKEKYCDGSAYFLYKGPIEKTIDLLKAFSIFKKRQKSSMKLLLTGNVEHKASAFMQQLQAYRFREHIVLLGAVADEVEEKKIMASAYAFINLNHHLLLNVFEALAASVAVLTPETSGLHELTKDAAIFFKAGEVNDLAEKLMLIYKDEQLHHKVIDKSRKIIDEQTWGKSAAKLAHFLGLQGND